MKEKKESPSMTGTLRLILTGRKPLRLEDRVFFYGHTFLIVEAPAKRTRVRSTALGASIPRQRTAAPDPDGVLSALRGWALISPAARFLRPIKPLPLPAGPARHPLPRRTLRPWRFGA